MLHLTSVQAPVETRAPPPRPRPPPSIDEYSDEEDYYSENFKHEIQSIFGRKRRRPMYEDEYDDYESDGAMEVGWSGVEEEERRSARFARMEDTEEEMAENARKKKKQQLKKGK